MDLDLDGAEDRYRLEPADTTTPERLFERRWALTLLETVLGRLEQEMQARGHQQRFQHLKVFLEGDGTGPAYEDIAADLSMTAGTVKVSVHRMDADLSMTAGTVKVSVHRMRSRFRELLRQEVAHTLADPDDADGELQELLAALRA